MLPELRYELGSILELALNLIKFPVTGPLSHTTTFGYDTKGNLTTITNALNKTTTITVNISLIGSGLVSCSVQPLCGTCVGHGASLATAI